MTGIHFVGSPNPYYVAVNSISEINADCLVCVNSEYELITAMKVEKLGVKGLSVPAALNCINRLMLRLALVGTGLNPKFRPVEILPGVIKTSFSSQNTGVYFIHEETYSEVPAQLKVHFPELKAIGVWEEFVVGESFEITGFIINGEINYRRGYKQTWNSQRNRIIRFESKPITEFPLELTTLALKRLGLDNTFFDIELMLMDDGTWKLIEVNPRLGEDPRLDCDFLTKLVEEFCSKFYEE